MPLPDLTIDTNVFLHSCNNIELRHGDSLNLVQHLLSCTTNLAIDEGFSLDSALNKSLIGSEYLNKIVPGSLPSALLTSLALGGRISMFKTKLTPQLSKKLNQMVAKPRDRTFIKVSANSVGRTLVSHDFEDFSPAKRRDLSDSFGITVLEAGPCLGML
ncbi:hypothetical protein [Polaromonas sp. CF318]|uniref:hypothetical protein n=1 Tax=Polaromonas sp. CF318 TaxID=1144318 RepID=UPI0012FAD414|nr:hypothetical protein [Polaromonas sp. CF318]